MDKKQRKEYNTKWYDENVRANYNIEIPNCKHENREVINGNFGPHKSKIVCSNCFKFISWNSLKTPEERAENKKFYIKKYYDELQKNKAI